MNKKQTYSVFCSPAEKTNSLEHHDDYQKICYKRKPNTNQENKKPLNILQVRGKNTPTTNVSARKCKGPSAKKLPRSLSSNFDKLLNGLEYSKTKNSKPVEPLQKTSISINDNHGNTMTKKKTERALSPNRKRSFSNINQLQLKCAKPYKGELDKIGICSPSNRNEKFRCEKSTTVYKTINSSTFTTPKKSKKVTRTPMRLLSRPRTIVLPYNNKVRSPITRTTISTSSSERKAALYQTSKDHTNCRRCLSISKPTNYKTRTELPKQGDMPDAAVMRPQREARADKVKRLQGHFCDENNNSSDVDLTDDEPLVLGVIPQSLPSLPRNSASNEWIYSELHSTSKVMAQLSPNLSDDSTPRVPHVGASASSSSVLDSDVVVQQPVQDAVESLKSSSCGKKSLTKKREKSAKKKSGNGWMRNRSFFLRMMETRRKQHKRQWENNKGSAIWESSSFLFQKDFTIEALADKLEEANKIIYMQESEITFLKSEISKAKENAVEEECLRVQADIYRDRAENENRLLKATIEDLQEQLNQNEEEDLSNVDRKSNDVTIINKEISTTSLSSIISKRDLGAHDCPHLSCDCDHECIVKSRLICNDVNHTTQYKGKNVSCFTRDTVIRTEHDNIIAINSSLKKFDKGTRFYPTISVKKMIILALPSLFLLDFMLNKSDATLIDIIPLLSRFGISHRWNTTFKSSVDKITFYSS